MVNRRQHPRIAYQQKVDIKLYHVDGHPDLKDRTIIGKTADISEGGVGLRLDREIKSGTELKLRIFVADPPSAFMQMCVVRWTLKDDDGLNFFVGVEFVGASEDHMDEWRRLVRHIEFQKKTNTGADRQGEETT